MQTNKTAQCHHLQHSGVFGFNSPGNSVVANIARQSSQQFKQASNAAQLFVSNGIKPCITRVRLVMHDACVLSVQTIANSLDPQTTGCIEQNEVYFWKRDQGAISNV